MLQFLREQEMNTYSYESSKAASARSYKGRLGTQ